MRLLARTLLVTLALVSALSLSAADRIYAVVDYMHLPEGKTPSDYLSIEKLWQRIHQKAVDTGISLAWFVFRVENGGRNQFVTVRIYDSLDKMANPWPAALVQGLYSEEEMSKMQKTGDVRDLTHSEIWQYQASADKGLQGEMPASIQVDFMKPRPGKESAYADFERGLFQKVHKARIDAGMMTRWDFLSRMFPSGVDSEYDYVTVNGFPAKGPRWDDKILQSALTKEELAKLPKSVDELRVTVRQEIWYPELQTAPAKK